MNLIPAQYRLAARAVAWMAAAAAIAFALWWAYTTIWERGAAHVQAQWDRAVVEQAKDAEAERERMADEIAAIDQSRLAQLQEKENEIDRLRADVAAGARRLRVAARCPAPASGSGVGDAAPAEPGAAAGSTGDAYLDPAAEPAYFALKAGLVKQREQLLACQAILTSERQ